MRHLEEVCFAPGIGSTLKERAGEEKGVVGPVSERREPMQKDSGAKDLPGASSVSGFWERLTRRWLMKEEVGSGSGGETQERAGAGEGVVGPVSKKGEAGEEG